MSSDLFGFDNSFLYETSQHHLFFETAAEIEDNFLIEVINESSSWEQIASLLPPKSELELREAAMEVKREECDQLSFGNPFSSSHEFMQTNYCQNEKLFPFGPHFDRVLMSENWRNQFLASPESTNGDLQKEKTKMVAPFSSEKSLMEEANFKVGKYSKEERKWRIERYRAKRARRNFNKTIKYACRKTLADGRQRIRGRFARNDEAGKILEASLLQTYYM